VGNPDKPVETWCMTHWGQIRDGVKDGTMNGTAAAIYLMEELLQDDRFMRRLGWNPETGAKADASSPAVMNAAIAEVSPICCWLPEIAMKRLYEYARRARQKCLKCLHLRLPKKGCQPGSVILTCSCDCHGDLVV
jgi:hypothetical protein